MVSIIRKIIRSFRIGYWKEVKMVLGTCYECSVCRICSVFPTRFCAHCGTGMSKEIRRLGE